MGSSVSPNKELAPEELKRALDEMLRLLLEKNPQLQMTAEKKKEFVDSLYKALTSKGETYTRGQLFEPEFIKKLAVCVTVSLSSEKTENLQDDFSKVFKLLESKQLDMNALLKMKPDEFKKKLAEKLSPDEVKEVKGLLEKIADKLLKKATPFGMEPKPDASKKLADDMYTNLLGVLNSAVTGSIAVPLQTYQGNGLGIVDYNPNDGTAPIDRINSVSDTQFGDSLGLNAAAVNNYMSMGDTIVDEVQESLYHNGLNPGAQRPGYHPPTHVD